MVALDRSTSRLARVLVGVLLVVGWVAPATAAEQFSGQVVSVIDGDTVGVLRDGREVRVRLEGIDCPEATQDFGASAKQFTSDLVFAKTVTVNVRDVDRYRRLVARLMIDNNDVSVALVRAGLAWHFTRYSKDAVLADAERQARTNRTGLWVQPNAVPPWTYRRPAARATSPQPPRSSTQSATVMKRGNRQ